MHPSSACRKPDAVDGDPDLALWGKELLICNCSSLWQKSWDDSVHHPLDVSSRLSWVGGHRSSRPVLVWRSRWVEALLCAAALAGLQGWQPQTKAWRQTGLSKIFSMVTAVCGALGHLYPEVFPFHAVWWKINTSISEICQKHLLES